MGMKTGKAFADPSAMTTQMREDSDFCRCRAGCFKVSTFNDLVLANIVGHHIASRRWTWHSPNGQHHNQIDYILMRKHFRSGLNNARTQSLHSHGIEIRAKKTKLMTNNTAGINKDIKVNRSLRQSQASSTWAQLYPIRVPNLRYSPG